MSGEGTLPHLKTPQGAEPDCGTKPPSTRPHGRNPRSPHPTLADLAREAVLGAIQGCIYGFINPGAGAAVAAEAGLQGGIFGASKGLFK